ncbi:MAG: hypothetical protein IT572_12070 [Deltaproteobacteria bacterium]|nr:hypothetical protein [Deltaproteobacteria bacterium]
MPLAQFEKTLEQEGIRCRQSGLAKETRPSPFSKIHLEEIVSVSRSLRKERELAFYGTEDWIPTEEYSEKDSTETIQKVEKFF